LARAYNLLPNHSFLELCSTCASLPKDISVILRVDCLDGLSHEALPDVVDNAGNCAKSAEALPHKAAGLAFCDFGHF
jgi:hypothetical protein